MICPYGTGRAFTNARLYRQHVRDWPEIARVNGLNLDGTPVGVEAPAPIDEVDGILPAGFPGRDALIEAGYTHLHDVAALTLPELTRIPGIGKSTAAKILIWTD